MEESIRVVANMFSPRMSWSPSVRPIFRQSVKSTSVELDRGWIVRPRAQNIAANETPRGDPLRQAWCHPDFPFLVDDESRSMLRRKVHPYSGNRCWKVSGKAIEICYSREKRGRKEEGRNRLTVRSQHVSYVLYQQGDIASIWYVLYVHVRWLENWN